MELKDFNFAIVKGSFIAPLTTSKLLHFGCLEGGRNIQWFIILITDGQISRILSLTFWSSTHLKCWKIHFHSVQNVCAPSLLWATSPIWPSPPFHLFSEPHAFDNTFLIISPQWNTTKTNSYDKVIFPSLED